MTDEVSQEGEVRQSDWRTIALRVIALMAAIAITVAGYLLRDELQNLEVLGYPGVFLISLVSNATVVLPAPGFIVTIVAGSIFNPILVAIAAAAGAALGELTGYLAGIQWARGVRTIPLLRSARGIDGEVWRMDRAGFGCDPKSIF